MGELHLSLDEGESAAEAFRRALKLTPNGAAAFRGLALAKRLGPDARLVSRMRSLAESRELPPREAAQIHYTLAQIFKEAGRQEDFVRHLLAANVRQRSLSEAGRENYDAVFDAVEATFSREALAVSARARPVSPTPIFVLGMPRSGTTLVERLLASHPEVAAGGELDYVRGPLRRRWEQRYRRPFPEGFQALPADELDTWAEALARRMALIDPRARCVTDKTPGNFHVLGLLRVLFPRGKVVHVARDPMDTCFSILQHPFDDRSPHTCDMTLLAHFYRRYKRLMDRWHELLGDEFITVRYEQLVVDPSAQARRLFEHCGLKWDERYLDAYRSGGAVRTFSAAQVRRPIYSSSVGAWRPYAEVLAPLQRGLQGGG